MNRIKKIFSEIINDPINAIDIFGTAFKTLMIILITECIILLSILIMHYLYRL